MFAGGSLKLKGEGIKKKKKKTNNNLTESAILKTDSISSSIPIKTKSDKTDAEQRFEEIKLKRVRRAVFT